MGKSSLESVFDACRAALSQSPGGLFSDFDGTLSHVARTPGEARIAKGAAPALTTLSSNLALVAIVTGRSAADARRLIPVDGIVIIGNHGLERLTYAGASIHPDAARQIVQIGEAIGSVQSALSGTPLAEHLVFENKNLSASIHYRLATDQEAARELIVDLANREAERRGLRVTEGKLVVELRPALEVNKGSAMRDAITELGLKGCVMLGDDVTDVDAFLALRALETEGVRGVSIAVRSEETHPLVEESADFHVDGVDECVQLLRRLADHFAGQ